MKKFDVYLYGMILRTQSFLLRGAFPALDTYGEIKDKYCLTGGETGTAATVLASLGCRVKMDGNHMGYNTADTIRSFYQRIGVDTASLYYDDNYAGLEDYVIIDTDTRTVFGTFGAYFNDETHRWNVPNETDIQQAKAAGIDPFFGEESVIAARLCRAQQVPFATIDCRYDSELCRLASVIAVSGEFIRDKYPEHIHDDDKIKLLQTYTQHTDALIIFTSGSGDIIYGRRNRINRIPAYKVKVVSTLGAGDTFKAGCVYGLLQGWDDDVIVRFASGCAAVACTKFPLPLHPPTLTEIESLY